MHWPQNHSVHFVEEENLLSLLGFKPQIVQPVAYLLYCIHSPISIYKYVPTTNCRLHNSKMLVNHKGLACVQ